jgi:hypothetical protein
MNRALDKFESLIIPKAQEASARAGLDWIVHSIMKEGKVRRSSTFDARASAIQGFPGFMEVEDARITYAVQRAGYAIENALGIRTAPRDEPCGSGGCGKVDIILIYVHELYRLVHVRDGRLIIRSPVPGAQALNSWRNIIQNLVESELLGPADAGVADGYDYLIPTVGCNVRLAFYDALILGVDKRACFKRAFSPHAVVRNACSKGMAHKISVLPRSVRRHIAVFLAMNL